MKASLIIIFSILIVSCKQTPREMSSSKVSAETSTNELDLDIKVMSKISYRSLVLNCKLSRSEIDSLSSGIDEMRESAKLRSYIYPEKSFCGGSLEGFYKRDTLVMTDAKYRGEIGARSQRIYWSNSNIIKLVYEQLVPDMEKYLKLYPKDEYEFDSEKLTFLTRITEITLGEVHEAKTMLNRVIVSNELDSILVTNLVECAIGMKEELETKKVPKM